LAGDGVRQRLADLLAEISHLGAITVTTPDRREIEEHGVLDLVTVIHLDGAVITHVSEELLRDPARLYRRFDEHQGRVKSALSPLTHLGRLSASFERAFAAALIVVPQLGWIMHAWGIYRGQVDLKSWTSLMLFGVGVVGGPLGYAVRGYATRFFNRVLRYWARRAIPAVTRKVLGAGRG
jgi:hypothetical protein